MEGRIVRLKHNLYVSGIGVMVLGGWSIVRVLITILMIPEFIKSQLEILSNVKNAKLILALIVIAVMIIIIAIHLHIGFNAMSAARGKKYQKIYLFMTVVLLILTIRGIPGYFTELGDESRLDTALAAGLVDVTLAFFLIDILYSSIMIKKMKE